MQKEQNDKQVQQINRRQFIIRLGAASATVTVIGAGISALLNQGSGTPEPQSLPVAQSTPDAQATADGTPETVADNPHPNADDPVEPAEGTRPEYTPVEDHYRIDIAATPPVIDEAEWVLPITGLVGNELQLTLDDLKNNYEPVEQYITMSCISNRVAGSLIGTTLWTGASFRDVLADAEPASNATHVKITSADGFDETVSLEEINNDPEITLNYYWDNEPLPVRNGFPIRIHLPNRYGMKQPKWITGMELLDGDEDGYWVRRGWSKDAFVRSTAVIDTVAMDMMVGENGDERHIVPVGGIAWAGPRRISKVEVQINNGEWQEAQLRAPLNNDTDEYKTWVIWRLDWPFEEGNHTFTVRCTEGDDTPQIEEINGVRPDGATGLHSLDANV